MQLRALRAKLTGEAELPPVGRSAAPRAALPAEPTR
jgi:hypothetical protein